MRSPLERDVDNPIITADMFDQGSVLVSNPGVAAFDDRLVMAIRVDHGRSGDGNIDGSTVAFASSHDEGATWTIDTLPAIDRTRAIKILAPAEPLRDLTSEVWRVYDPRLTTIDVDGCQQLALCLAVDTTHGLRPALLTSADGHAWHCRNLGPPDDRNHVLFPDPIDGRWHRLTRPMHDYGGEALGAGAYEIWLQRSPDLEHWGHDRMLLDPTSLSPDVEKVGPGPPPIRTKAGWLCLTHIVTEARSHAPRGWEPNWSLSYAVGGLLLDLNDPARVVAVAPVPLLTADESYERMGYRHDVVFATGCHVRGADLDVYYGAADTVVAKASAPLASVIDFVLSGRQKD